MHGSNTLGLAIVHELFRKRGQGSSPLARQDIAKACAKELGSQLPIGVRSISVGNKPDPVVASNSLFDHPRSSYSMAKFKDVTP